MQKLPFAVAALALSLTPTSGDESSTVADPLIRGTTTPPANRIGLSYRAGFNYRASFGKLGGLPPISNPGGMGSEQDRTYDDGDVRRDSSIGDGYTWNWSHRSDSQVPGNDTIEFHSASSAGDASLSGLRCDPHHGVELSYQRHLATWDGYWGVEIAASFTPIRLASSKTAYGSATRLTDIYALNGVIPPYAPYNGSFAGPGPLISDAPTRSLTEMTGGTAVSGRHELDANMFGFRVGGYYQLPFNRQSPRNRWSVIFSGGFAFAAVNSEFSFRESVTADSALLGTASGQDRHTGFATGVYGGADISFALNRRWSVFAGAQYQHLGSYTHKAYGREAKLDFSHTVSARAGISYAF